MYLKMDIGIILVVSILVLGSVIATVGDRIGTRVGKARLSLFKMRPRQTAVLVTIITGFTISASTLAILFATSKPLRKGVFQLDQLEVIQRRLKGANEELEQKIAQKNQIQRELAKAKSDIAEAENRLNATNKSLEIARRKQSITDTQLAKTQSQLKSVSQQSRTLRSDIQTLLGERQGLIQQRDQVKAAISQLKSQNIQLESELTTAKAKQVEAQKRLDATNASLKKGQAENAKLEKELSSAKSEQIEAQNRLNAINESLKKRQAENTQLEKELAIAKSDQIEAQNRLNGINESLKKRQNENIALEKQLQEREKQLAFLQDQLAVLEKYYQVLRQGNLALFRGQVLSSGVVRIVNPTAANQAVDQLLTQANHAAIDATRPNKKDFNDRVVQIGERQVAQLLTQIKDGKDYVVRIISVSNYFEGEKQVEVFADAVVNQVVFTGGEIMAATSTDPTTVNEEQIRKQLEQLVVAAQFRARRAGIVNDKVQIGDGRIITLIRFIEQLKQYKQSIDLQVVIEENTYTAGPLKIKLVGTKDGQVIFST